MKTVWFALATVALLFAGDSKDGARRGVTPEDYFAFKSIADVRISPDGALIAYSVVSVDEKQNRRNSVIWIVSPDRPSDARPFTTGPSSRLPRWSPDGRTLAFVATRAEIEAGAPNAAKPQVYALSLTGGEARRLTDLENGVDTFAWSSDGARLVCVSKVLPPGRKPGKNGNDERHYTSADYKFNDTGWYDDRRSHLFVVDLKSSETKQITFSPSRNDLDPQWSPDGGRIAFSSNDTDKPDQRKGDVWVVAATGGDLARITKQEGSYRSPRWSPNGSRIAFSGGPGDDDYPKLWIASASGAGQPALASKRFDLVPGEYDWDRAGDAILIETGYHGTTHLFRVALGSGDSTQVTKGERAVLHVDRNERAHLMAYVANDFKHLDDLYVALLDGGNERQLTHLNQVLWTQFQVADVERVSYKAEDGWDIDGFFVKPVGWQAGKSYPMVVSIHGGPAGQYGVDWYHEFQVYAAKGWAVFFVNPRGSTGYGEKFQRGVYKEWGGKAYTDIMKGVDAALAKYPWVDRNRLGVTGGSYGGFMTNWIVSHDNRFKAAVTLRSISNFVSDDGTRDGAYGHARDFGANLFDDFQYYWEMSPLKYAANVKTPTLILHSDNDYRVPIEQGEQWFRALKHFGVTSELVVFPRENHNLTRTGEPKHLVESLSWQIYWFDRFLNGNESAVPPNE